MSYPLLDAIEQKGLDDYGWKPAYISFAYFANATSVTLDTANGEDFLFMHRQMINTVNDLANGANPPWSVQGWTQCPTPSDTDWPVPAIPSSITSQSYITYLEGYKSVDFYNTQIVPRQDWINANNYSNLLNMTLGELGAILEYELHTYFHVRFSGFNTIGYRFQDAHPTAFIDTKWDDQDYDYLADFYSAHVNPTFWKIHGWIEFQIAKWLLANNMTEPIAWTSFWVGGPPEQIPQLWTVAADGIARQNHHSKVAGMIVGSVIGAAVVVIILGGIAYWGMLKYRFNGGNRVNQRAHHTQESKPLAKDEEARREGVTGTIN